MKRDRKIIGWMFAVALLLGCGFVLSAIGQDAEPTMNEVAVEDAASPASNLKRCDLVFGETGQDVLVLDENGEYQRRVRYITLYVQIGSRQPVVRVQSWDGPYKPAPSLIDKGEWSVRNIRHASAEEFAAIVNQEGGAASEAPNVAPTPPAAPKKVDPFERKGGQ